MFSFLRHGLHSWKSAKGVAILAIVAIALGIGSTTAIYSVIQGVLLNPLGYPHQDRFLVVWSAFSNRPGWQSSFSYLDELEFVARARSVDAFGCFSKESFNVTYQGDARRVVGTQLSPILPQAIGIRPALGRWFQEPGKEASGLYSAVISAALWNALGSSPDIIGKSLTMNGKSYTVLGVMPASFSFPPDAPDNDVWVPLNPSEDQRTRRGYHFLACLAKIKPNATVAQTQADLERITLQLRHEYADEFFSDRILVRPLLEEVVIQIRPTLLLLLWAAAALFLITCANVAGLLLARSVVRARETAVRVALGAAPWQLGLQYLAEGLLVSVTGAVLGILLSYSLVRIVISIAGDRIPRAQEVTVDWHVLLFALGLAIVCGVLFSLAPLWQARRVAPQEVLSDGVRASASARSRGLLRVFVVAEIALSFVLLTVASVLLYQLGSLRTMDRGFDLDHVLTMNIFAPILKYPDASSRAAYESKLVKALESLPGVESAGFTQLLPLTGWGANTMMNVEGRPAIPDNQAESIEDRFISPDYFKAMGIPLIGGRFFNDRDVTNELPGTMALLINQTTAHLYWPHSNPIGAFVRIGAWDKARFQVVGVVGNVRNAGLLNAPRPEIYLSYLEVPMEEMAWAVRSKLDPQLLSRAIRRAVLRVDPEQPVFDIQPMRQVLEKSIYRQRLQSFMISFFAATALLLALLGVYGVVSYTVRQRTAEIGTRMAVGATSRDLMRLVIGDGLKMAGIGITMGIVVVIGLASFLNRGEMRIEIDSITPFLIPTVLLTCLTAFACFFPAWRATLVSPMIAIRNEPGAMWQRTRWGILRVAEQFSGLMARSDEQAASKEADLLAEIADASRRSSSFHDAIRAALECLRKSIDATSVALFVQPRDGEPYRCHGVIPDTCADDWTLPPDTLIVGRLRNYAGAMPIESGELDASRRWAAENAPQHLPGIALLREMGAAMAVRIAVKKEISAVLFIGQPAGRPRYTLLERRLLRGVAAQFALMLENSRLTDRIVEQERLRRDLLLGTEVQKRLLPQSAPQTANLQLAGICIPARGVGGDYYDFLDLGNRNLGIALADVAGKGIAAALLMSVVQASLRSLAGVAGASLADLATRMNRLLHRSTGSHSYATFFYAEVDEANRALRYVNAGHNPPYLLRGGATSSAVPFVASTAPIEELSTGGTIIGMFAQTDYEEGMVQLQSGDTLIAFTDGVPEALNPADEEYGEDRLKEILRRVAHLPVNDMAARILQDLKTWIADAAQYDDLTFILMKVN